MPLNLASPSPEPVVLLVDDDRHMRLFLKSRLAFLGAQIHLVGDGEEALAFLAGQRPHFILSDAVMPRMDGFELCRQVKKNPAFARIPFMLITSLSQNLRDRSQQAGADDYLSKAESDLVFRIRMRLMLAIGAREQAQGHPSPFAPPPSVLVVAKAMAIQTQLRTHLAKDGIEVQSVSSPGEVLNHLREQPADALIIDLDQPPSALDILLANLSNDPAFSTIPIMALATKTEEPNLASVEDQIQDRLLKPLDGQETRHRLALLLRLTR